MSEYMDSSIEALPSKGLEISAPGIEGKLIADESLGNRSAPRKFFLANTIVSLRVIRHMLK